MAAIQRKKDGGPNLKFFECLETIAQLEPVRVWLLKNAKKYIQNEQINNKTLSVLVVQLLHFQEEAFGKNVSKPALTKLPMACFLDFKPNGSLCNLLVEAFKFKTEQGWRKFDFQNPSRMDRNVDMFMQVQKNLIANNVLHQPSVFIREEVDKVVTSKLRDIIKRHLGAVVDSASDASHVVFPALVASPDEEELFRPVIKRDSSVMLHCISTPNSYDTWMSEFELDADVDGDEGDKPWMVNASWLLDLEEYNEWMNEDDYMVEHQDETSKHKTRRESRLKFTADELTAMCNEEKKNRKDRGKRRRSPSPSSISSTSKKKKGGRGVQSSLQKKRSTAPSGDNDDDLSRDFEDPLPEASITEVPFQRVLASSGPTSASGAAKPVLMELDDFEQQASGDAKASRPSTPHDTTNNLNNTTNTITNDDENNANADNNNNLTEQTHHIIIPSYTAWFECHSIHSIEKRGLPEFFNAKNKSKTAEVYMSYRNFMIDTYRLNPQEYLTSTACRRNLAGDVCAVIRVHAFLEQWGLINYQVDIDLKPTTMGPPSTSHFHILTDTPSGLQPFQPAKPAQSGTKQTVDFEKTQADKKDEVKKENNYNLKMDQYMKRNQGGSNYRDWTDQETLLLLEGLEMYRDDWNRVADHVTSRTQDECILHFLRLPIEMPFLDDATIGNHLGPLAYQPIPFSQAGNPIMSTVAFLASVVDPRIASAAAKAALEEFSRMKEEVPPWLVDTHLKNLTEARKEGAVVDENFGLDKTGIAGTVAESKEVPGENKKEEEKVEGGDKKEDTKDTQADKEKEEKEDEAKESSEKKDDEDKKEDDKKVDEKVEDEMMEVEDGKKEDEEKEEVKEGEKDEKEVEKEIKLKERLRTEKLGKKRVEGDINTAAASALAAAAVKAKHLATVEERKIKSLVALLVETQMKKLEIKLRHFEELESIMDKERDALEYQRQELLKERQQFHMEQLRAAEFRAKQLAAQQLAAEQKSAAASQASSNSQAADPASSDKQLEESESASMETE